jgi:hypothetical protein
MEQRLTRREFVQRLAATALAPIVASPVVRSAVRSPQSALPLRDHPDPRPGITAAKVLSRKELGGKAEAARVFDMVREMPQIVDGIRCHCGCADAPDHYSLLSCFEAPEAMARGCSICQGQAKLAHSLFKQGKSLDEIRAAIDEKYG